MAKVLGFDPKLNRYCSCRNCSAMVEYTNKDIVGTKKINHDYLGDYDVVKYIICPNCNKDITL